MKNSIKCVLLVTITAGSLFSTNLQAEISAEIKASSTNNNEQQIRAAGLALGLASFILGYSAHSTQNLTSRIIHLENIIDRVENLRKATTALETAKKNSEPQDVLDQLENNRKTALFYAEDAIVPDRMLLVNFQEVTADQISEKEQYAKDKLPKLKKEHRKILLTKTASYLGMAAGYGLIIFSDTIADRIGNNDASIFVNLLGNATSEDLLMMSAMTKAASDFLRNDRFLAE